ncbi:hypothetical protein RJT34_25032 [Clitoria ternatea]|uniref:Uncharacterized protein n=1 Tax=Clitoria ternatea TaxID=43366 RepID=A0AAN9IJP7_CLITE
MPLRKPFFSFTKTKENRFPFQFQKLLIRNANHVKVHSLFTLQVIRHIFDCSPTIQICFQPQCCSAVVVENRLLAYGILHFYVVKGVVVLEDVFYAEETTFVKDVGGQNKEQSCLEKFECHTVHDFEWFNMLDMMEETINPLNDVRINWLSDNIVGIGMVAFAYANDACYSQICDGFGSNEASYGCL